jgi:hypothetical protein
MKRRAASASRRSCSATEPTRSAKTTVTTLRAIAFSAAGAAISAPQEMQKRASAWVPRRSVGQRGGESGPQPPQKRAPAGFVRPQLAQFIARSR